VTDLIEITWKKQVTLGTLLDQMEVPAMRRRTDVRSNIRWLNRNLRIENGDHPMIDTAMDLVVWLMKEGA
jgi:hypothetical protein